MRSVLLLRASYILFTAFPAIEKTIVNLRGGRFLTEPVNILESMLFDRFLSERGRFLNGYSGAYFRKNLVQN